MSPVEEESKDVVDSLSDVMKEISELPECRHPAKKQYGSLVRRLKLLSPLFEELKDREDEALTASASASASSSAVGEEEFQALVSLKLALDSAYELLQSVNEGSKLYQESPSVPKRRHGKSYKAEVFG